MGREGIWGQTQKKKRSQQEQLVTAEKADKKDPVKKARNETSDIVQQLKQRQFLTFGIFSLE